MKNIIIYLAFILTFGCSKLEQEPKSSLSKTVVFESEQGLELYSKSFYEVLPSGEDVAIAGGDNISDFMARREVPNFIRPGAFSARESSGWDWSQLRNINYFIENINSSSVPEEIKHNYLGLARFFRALFYYEKVIRFGDVPWITKPLDVNDEALFNQRNNRFEVMDSVLADINYAIDHIKLEDDPSRTLISKNIALGFKSRICLFEATFRKYHDGYGYKESSNQWLEEAAESAKQIIESDNYTLFQGENAYRDLFISTSPISSEVMLANVYDLELGTLHRANWFWTSATYGIRGSFIRTFINTYLNIDGTPFTDNPGYKSMTFQDETKGRDLRLKQTIRTADYKRQVGGISTLTPPKFSYTYTGYQPIKFVLDDPYYDGAAYNDNVIPIMRYAEILLNYAEAKAELGSLSKEGWDFTIGELRRRAGIKNVEFPLQADEYLQNNYFPEISDPVILEVRRERGIELAMEGFRYNDLIRWKKGELLEMEWNGMYVPYVDQYIDLNEDSVMDVYFYLGTPKSNDNISGVTYIDVYPTLSDGTPNPLQLRNGEFGELIWLNNIERKWEEKNYFYPIPESDRLINPNLGQNPGW